MISTPVASPVSLTPVVLAHGQCHFAFVSTTQVKLSPKGGRLLTIGGKDEQIPAAGVVLANTGLTAASRYYVYAYMAGALMTLEGSTTGHSTDAASGVEVKTGDSSRTLVGLVYMGAGTPGVFQAQGLGTLSWFNRRAQHVHVHSAIYNSRNNAVYGEIDIGFRVHFVNWADDNPRACIVTTHGANAAGDGWGALYLDGTTLKVEQYHGQASADFSPMTLYDEMQGITNETDHYITMFVKGSTTIYVGGNQTSNQSESASMISVMG